MFIELGYCIIHQLLGFDNIFSLKIIIISFSPRDTKFSLKNGKKTHSTDLLIKERSLSLPLQKR